MSLVWSSVHHAGIIAAGTGDGKPGRLAQHRQPAFIQSFRKHFDSSGQQGGKGGCQGKHDEIGSVADNVFVGINCNVNEQNLCENRPIKSQRK